MPGGLPRLDNNFLSGRLVKDDALGAVDEPLRVRVRLMHGLCSSDPDM